MVFKRLLGAIGVGAPSVDTVLEGGAVLPGGTLGGRVLLRGGSAAADIEQITLELVARVEAEGDDGEHEGTVSFGRFPVGGAFRLGEEEAHEVPFSLVLPWETPITELHGQSLGLPLGVRTELAVAGARDAGDLDPLAVRPLPVQEAVLEAFGQLGFAFTSADLELGHIPGTGQQLPFYQEIELAPGPQFAHAMQEVEVTFLASPGGMEVVLEADKRGGMFSAGHDALARFTVSHHDVAQADWTALVDSWVKQLAEHRGAPPGSYGHGGHHHGEDHGRRGPGMGTVAVAAAGGLAAGVVGGMVAAEVVDEIGDAFEDEEE
ncbi:sporulation protein [Streptomyces sp. WAC 06738]|uniref:sporulation protein n=1 Tax=Streptomyces sp. WAC 06738 TaxID=2203210 RepID=UPI000F6E5A5D|nr:sporulation protein [Streptomyces sp. WAC 06738]AZM47483.1 sporulation protein [Streptomyces sp. WAC 06738]